MKYAVLEWVEGDNENANVIAKDQSKHIAEMLLKICPQHLYREIKTMDELYEIYKNNR